jgi:hypothetical protein
MEEVPPKSNWSPIVTAPSDIELQSTIMENTMRWCFLAGAMVRAGPTSAAIGWC